MLIAHSGAPPAPHDLWTAWNADPLLLATFAAVGLLHRAGRADRDPVDARRARAFTAAMVVLAVALLSPLDAMSGALAAAHMVQHVLLVLAAAPLLALAAPGRRLWRGVPRSARRIVLRTARRLGWGTRASRRAGRSLGNPYAAWTAHVVALWGWHASGPYDAALDVELIHALEHLTFLATAMWFWRAVLGGRRAAPATRGIGVLLLFGMALQSVLLSALLTFAPTPWYSAYSTTTGAWGLDHLEDQQLAGLIMWVPAGLVHTGAAIALLIAWLRASERDAPQLTFGTGR